MSASWAQSEGAGPWSPSGTGSTLAPPGAPAAPTVRVTSAPAMVVSWTKPAANGAAITDYDVQYRPVWASGWQAWAHSGTTLSTTPSGLQAGTRYEVQVRARNALGWSAWSESGTGTTGMNTVATGEPTLSATAPRVGETLTADPAGIMDPDGLTHVVYTY